MQAVRVLVIGTCHAYQRRQDKSAERERIRADFEKLIRATIDERRIDLIAEEAGSAEEVHAQLKADEAKTAAFGALFARTEAVDEPRDTIAKLIADEVLGGNHVDIRPPGAAPLPPDADEALITERDTAMAAKIMGTLGSSTSVLVICGEKHRVGLTNRLESHELNAESLHFPGQG